MLNALYIAATGLQAEQHSVEAISNNLSNMDTPGYKTARVQFSNLVDGTPALVSAEASQTTSPGAAGAAAQGASTAVGGMGVAVSGTRHVFDAGQYAQTGSQFDLAVRGDGFIEVVLPDGSSAYTRGGTLKINADGMLATQDGYPLKAGVAIPADAQSISISSDGTVNVSTATDASLIEAGHIDVVRFSSEGDLSSLGGGLYQPDDASGDPLTQRAGENGAGLIAQGYLEQSNVNMVSEMVNLMVAQRAYQANAKLVQAADDMLSTVNGLRR